MVKDDKTRKTGTDPVSTEGKTVGEAKPKKIMVQPLPQILDEIEDSIRSADEAARDARKAAEEARQAGEEAASAAQKAAEAAVAKVREEATKAINALGTKVSALQAELNTLKEKARQEALALDQAFVAAKDRHIEESPFLKK